MLTKIKLIAECMACRTVLLVIDDVPMVRANSTDRWSCVPERNVRDSISGVVTTGKGVYLSWPPNCFINRCKVW